MMERYRSAARNGADTIWIDEAEVGPLAQHLAAMDLYPPLGIKDAERGIRDGTCRLYGVPVKVTSNHQS
jgi:hypothetical protein